MTIAQLWRRLRRLFALSPEALELAGEISTRTGRDVVAEEYRRTWRWRYRRTGERFHVADHSPELFP